MGGGRSYENSKLLEKKVRNIVVSISVILTPGRTYFHPVSFDFILSRGSTRISH